MIDTIPLDHLPSRLEIAYDFYSKDSDPDTLHYWKDYLDQHPEQVDICVNILLAKEKKEKKPGMHRSVSDDFLRDTPKNLAAEILLHIINQQVDEEYFQARLRNAEAIQAKLTELELEDGISDDELDNPNFVNDKKRHEAIKKFSIFLENLPHAVFYSKRFELLYAHLSQINLGETWVDKVFNLLSIADHRKGKSQRGVELQAQRFLRPSIAIKNILTRRNVDANYKTLLEKLTEFDLPKNSTLSQLFLFEYKRLCAKNPENIGLAQKRFTRFFLWQCKNASIGDVNIGNLFRSFLHSHKMYNAFGDNKVLAPVLPSIKPGIRSIQKSAQTEDSTTLTDHHTIAFGEDMSGDEQQSLLQHVFRENASSTLSCCIATHNRITVNLKGNDKAFLVTRNKKNHADIGSFKSFSHLETLGINLGEEREAFVLLVSGNVSEKELKEKLQAFPERAHTLPTTLVRELSTNNGKEPIAISLLPIKSYNKQLRYAVHIESENPEAAAQFKQQLEACREFDHYKKLKTELAKIIKETEFYYNKLDAEIKEEKDVFLSNYRTSRIAYHNEDGQVTNIEVSEVTDEVKALFDKEIRAKALLRYEVYKLLQELRNPEKTSLTKIREFSESLFRAPEPPAGILIEHSDSEVADQPAAPPEPSLAKKIESTKIGYHYLKAVFRTLAAFSIVLTIPTVIYCVANHKWPWQTEGKALTNLTDSLKTKFVR